MGSILLYLPVVFWAGTGIGLAWALRRSTAPIVLRLAATFLALWSLLATTAVAWLIGNGGEVVLERAIRSPGSLAEALGSVPLGIWGIGALGAFAVYLAAFALNQWVGRALLADLAPSRIPWPARLPKPVTQTSLLSYPSEDRQAFSLTLLSFDPATRRPARHEIVALSEGLIGALTPEELEAVVAHELGHVHGLDGRYLTFVRTLSSMMRWDPVLALCARALTRRAEYRADDDAVRLTGRPLALARALFLASSQPGEAPMGASAAFLGTPGRKGRRDVVARIQRLVAMADAQEGSEDPGA